MRVCCATVVAVGGTKLERCGGERCVYKPFGNRTDIIRKHALVLAASHAELIDLGDETVYHIGHEPD